MYDTHKTVLPKVYRMYEFLLFLYPESYRQKFGYDMLITFEDMYRERIANQESVGLFFWLTIIFDLIKSASEENKDLMHKRGMKKYLQKTLHLHFFNIIGGILLVPFFSLFVIDVIARIAQGDLTRYNRPLYAFLSHTFLYYTPVLFTIAILFPVLAVLFNIIPIVQNIIKNRRAIKEFSFVKQNTLSILFLLIGLGFLAIIEFHDFAPCFVHGILRFGFTKLPYIISFCRNA